MATFQKAGLLNSKMMHLIPINSDGGLYLRIETSASINLILNIPKVGFNQLLLINCLSTPNSSEVVGCYILSIGNKNNVNVADARFMRVQSGTRFLELHFELITYFGSVGVIDLNRNIISYSQEAEPIPDSEISSSVNATIKHFDDL